MGVKHCDRWSEHSFARRAGRAGQTYPPRPPTTTTDLQQPSSTLLNPPQTSIHLRSSSILKNALLCGTLGCVSGKASLVGFAWHEPVPQAQRKSKAQHIVLEAVYFYSPLDCLIVGGPGVTGLPGRIIDQNLALATLAATEAQERQEILDSEQLKGCV